MFEGTHLKWRTDPTNGDETIAHIELLHHDFSKDDMLKLINELMAVRDRLRTERQS